MKFVFVYGSLKRGGFLNHIMESNGSRFLKTARLEGYSLWSVGGMFPAMLPMDEGAVKGEIWAVPESAMLYLDHVEAAYNRTLVTTVQGDEVEAYIWRLGLTSYMEFCGEEWDVNSHRSRVLYI